VNFRKSTASYEEWLSHQLNIIPQDLAQKHTLMRAELFPFFRATFYRWSQLFPEVCPECAGAPPVLAVGDLHVENFGTWRDTEGRLIWGINDFDEVSRMPWTIDLVRLAASAHLAINTAQLKITQREACGAVLAGYQAALDAGGLPWVLGGKHAWLYDMVKPSLRDPPGFWKKLDALDTHNDRVPGNARRALQYLMPKGCSKWRIAHRIAGLGSLGRQRFVAIAELNGGPVCREAKALAPSAWDWAQGRAGKNGRIRYQKALDTAIRVKDPYVHLEGKWIVRRLAPDCSRVDLAQFPKEKDETRLLHAMGWETANLHIGYGAAKEIAADLKKRPLHWLHKAAEAMVAATTQDWKEWQTAKA
jgi:hypothetical protein